MYPWQAVKVTGARLKVYRSSQHGRRHFLPRLRHRPFLRECRMLPSIIDIQSATTTTIPAVVPPSPHPGRRRIKWMERANRLPTFERYPPRQ